MKKIFFSTLFFLCSSLTFSSKAENDKYNNYKFENNNSFESSKTKNSYRNFISKSVIDKTLFKSNTNLLKISSQLNTFFNDVYVSLVNQNLNDKKNEFKINIDSDTQNQIGTKFIAEGDVVVRSTNGILKTSKFSYDTESKIIIIEGDINFRTSTQYLEASIIEYDLIKKKGFIKDAFGSINFNGINEISDFDNSINLNDDFDGDFKIKNVILQNSSKLEFNKTLKENDKSFSGQTIRAEINPVNRSRFKSKLIEINDGIWYAKKMELTNDPFNFPQLIINNKDFKLFSENDETRIKTKWSNLILENRLNVPLGPRNLNLDRKNYFRWGLDYDSNQNDGLYLYRSSNTLNLDKKNNTKLDFITKFNIQRAIKGTTESFSAEDDSVIGKKVELDSKFLDYIGFDSILKSSIGNWDYILKAETNSLDINKLDKILEGKTSLSKNTLFKQKNNLIERNDLSFFGSYREKTKNGSLGEILVNSAYGVNFVVKKIEIMPNFNITKDLSLGYGRYESISSDDQNILLSNNRLNLSLKQRNEYLIWKPKIETNLTKEYKYSPNIIAQGFYWIVEGNLDFFRYEEGSKQDLFLIKSGPKITLGEFKKSFFDYTELSIYPRFKFNNGKSPFVFDQVVDNKVIEFSLKQRIYKPIAIKFSGELNLENDLLNDNKFINPVIEISWNRRAYNFSLNYNFDTEVGGLNFNIFSFNFDGLGEKF